MAIYEPNIQQVDALGSFMRGAQSGQQMADQRRQNQARNALARLQQGDTSAMAELQQADPDAAMKYGEYQRAEETRNGLQGFFKPATGATNVVGVNSLTALANGKPAQPASYDFDGAMNYAAGRDEIEKAEGLAKLRESLQGGGNEAFGSTIWKGGRAFQLTKSGKLIDLGDGFDVPTRTIDTGTGVVVVPTKGQPIPVATFDKGIDPASVYSNNKQDARLERSAELDVSVAEAKKRAEAQVERDKDVAEQLRGADEAIADLTTLEGALSKLPSPAALKIESAKGFFGRGDPKVQEALGQASVISGRMLKYVERLPGAATDKDREVFMASAGVLTNEDLPVERRVAAARAAKEAYSRLMRKYGQQSDQKPAQGGQSKPQGVGKAAIWLKSRNIKTQQEAAAAVKQLQSQGWSRQQIEQALDQAGL